MGDGRVAGGEHSAGAAAALSADFRALFEAAPTPFLVLSPRLEIVAANDAYLAATMTTREAVVGRPLFEVFPDDPDDERADGTRNLRASLERVVATGRPDAMPIQRYPIPRPSEEGGGFEERWWSPINVPVLDRDGRLALIIHRVEDETARVHGEEALRDLTARLEQEVALRTAERDSMWQLSQDLLAVFDLDGRLVSASPAWERMLGLSPKALVGRLDSELKHPDDVGAGVDTLARLLEGEAVRGFVDRYRHADGSYRWISWTAKAEGALIYAVGRDVSEEKERAGALAAAEEQLRQAQKMEAIGRLTGGVAHDFNNLLTIVGTAVAFLRRRELPDERRRRYVDAISEAVDRGAKLTSQLLAFARRQALEPEVLDARERVRSVTDMLRSALGSRIALALEIEEGGPPFTVFADLTQFDTALVNMALNAKDAMMGEGRLTVRLAHCDCMPDHATGPCVAVSLTDTGHGIAEDAIDRVFEPFFTTKDVGRGTGLGLSQVFGFARQSNGDVRVESAPGAGATFTLYLPRVDAPVAKARPRPAARPLAEEGEGRRILVVEDNAEVGAFSSQILHDLGYETVHVPDASAALERLAGIGERFDAVFSDVMMPGMSGVELAREIERRFEGLPVVLTSGYSHVLAEHGLGGYPLVRKPYSAEDLSRALRSATGRGRAAGG